MAMDMAMAMEETGSINMVQNLYDDFRNLLINQYWVLKRIY
jgi:hypothetical protein